MSISDKTYETILERFGEEYERLYDADGTDTVIEGRHEMMEFGDQLIHECKTFVHELCQRRQDVFSSDREVAALGFAVMAVLG